MASVTTPEGAISYEYDSLGRKTRSVTDGGADTRYTHDSLNRLSTVAALTASATNVTRYPYNAVGSRESMVLPNGITTQYGYSKLNRLTQLTHINAAAELLGSYAYTLAADGRRTAATEALRPLTPDPLASNASRAERLKITPERISCQWMRSGSVRFFLFRPQFFPRWRPKIPPSASPCRANSAGEV